MFKENGEWVKTSPWGNYLTDSTERENDRQREIGKNSNHVNNKKHKKPRQVNSVSVHKTPFYVGIQVSNVIGRINKMFKEQ